MNNALDQKLSELSAASNAWEERRHATIELGTAFMNELSETAKQAVTLINLKLTSYSMRMRTHVSSNHSIWTPMWFSIQIGNLYPCAFNCAFSQYPHLKNHLWIGPSAGGSYLVADYYASFKLDEISGKLSFTPEPDRSKPWIKTSEQFDGKLLIDSVCEHEVSLALEGFRRDGIR
jgi:hypothetical protein